MRLRRKDETEILVMSRRAAVQYCQREQVKQSIMISISDPNMVYTDAPFCSPENRVSAILELRFSDADRPGKDVYGLDAEEKDLMSDEDAGNVVRFVQANRDKQIIVHCDAGISRSAGVAAAIAKYLTGNDDFFFNSGRYIPNMWCYTKTLTAFFEE